MLKSLRFPWACWGCAVSVKSSQLESFLVSRQLMSCDTMKQYDIIIIMSHNQHGYPWTSLATPPYRTLLPVGLQVYIPYWHGAAVCRFELVTLPLFIHVKGSTGVCHLWVRLYFSSMSGSSNFDSFRDGWTVAVSCCFVRCCLHDLFSIAHSILV